MQVDSFRNKPPFDRLLLFASRWTPKLRHVLLIESGSRDAAGKFLAEIYGLAENERVDVLTCYRTAPNAFDAARGRIFFTHDAQNRGRGELFEVLSQSGYSAICMLCTGDSIMTKWKWAAAARIPAKVLIVNENADSFWLDRGHLRDLRNLLIERSGMKQMTPLRTLAHAIAFPFTLAILVSFAGYMKSRRVLRSLTR
ncbi:MAG TPA: hypothetical protein VN633_24780 [Bryobacteraceae bacterium]|nr:hypothetical protein [Bryobacteraceae bacterium]